MAEYYESSWDKLERSAMFGAAYYGALELQNRRIKGKHRLPLGLGDKTHFTSWECSARERMISNRYDHDRIDGFYYTGVEFYKAMSSPPKSEQWDKAYYSIAHRNDELITDKVILQKYKDESIEFINKKIEAEVLEIFKPTIPRDWRGRLRFDRKIFYDLPAPSDNAPEEAVAVYLRLKKLVDEQNDLLKNFVFDETKDLRNKMLSMGYDIDFVNKGHCFERGR